MIAQKPTPRQQAGLFNIAEVARLAGMSLPHFHWHLMQGEFFEPKTKYQPNKYYEGGQRRYYTAEEAEEIVARIALLRDLKAKIKEVRKRP